jgi:hypothetical protein
MSVYSFGQLSSDIVQISRRLTLDHALVDWIEGDLKPSTQLSTLFGWLQADSLTMEEFRMELETAVQRRAGFPKRVDLHDSWLEGTIEDLGLELERLRNKSRDEVASLA